MPCSTRPTDRLSHPVPQLEKLKLERGKCAPNDPSWNSKTDSAGTCSITQSSETHQAPCFPALSTEGIFRRSANTQVVREVQQKYNMGEWVCVCVFNKMGHVTVRSCKRGLFLPEVPVSFGVTTETFLLPGSLRLAAHLQELQPWIQVHLETRGNFHVCQCPHALQVVCAYIPCYRRGRCNWGILGKSSLCSGQG